MGILTNPKRAVYNRVYNRTTFGLGDLGRIASRQRGVYWNGLLMIVIGFLLLLLLIIWFPVVFIPIAAIAGYLFYAHKYLKWPFSLWYQDRELLLAYRTYQSGKPVEALLYFLANGPKDARNVLFASAILSAQRHSETQAMELLQGVIKGVPPFACPPTHNLSWGLSINVSPDVLFDLPMDKVGATLLLAKLYQNNNRIDEAIRLVESVADSAIDKAVRIFLCELYSQASLNIYQQQEGWL